MTRLIDLTGQRFGRLLVLGRSGTDKNKQAIWETRCDCGATTNALGGNLRRGLSASCGHCVSKAKHGLHGTPVYWVWNAMVRRCKNPTAQDWTDYGGRGVAVCDRWLEFENFYADMGQRPSDKHSIDRIDVNGNYEPGNCRLTTMDVQLHNTRVRSNTGERGISWIEHQKRFAWGVCRHGQHIKGWCKTFEEAIAGRDEATQRLYGSATETGCSTRTAS